MVASRSLWRLKSKLALAATALGAWAGGAAIAKSDDPATSLKLCTTVPVRLFRLSLTAATIAFGGPHSHSEENRGKKQGNRREIILTCQMRIKINLVLVKIRYTNL